MTMWGCKPDRPQFRIGVSQCSQDDWRSKMNDEISREMLFYDNATVEIRSAQDNNAKQIADIRYFMDNGFDIIIVAPNEAEAITPVVEEAYGKGIPVIIFDRDIIGDSYTAKVGVDNAAIGREAATYSRGIITGPVRIFELQGLSGSSPARGRHDGFAAAVGELPDMEIVASHPADWYELQAKRATDSILPLHPEVNLIYAHNDKMAIGAAASARAQGRDDVRVIGIDAAPNVGIRAVADSIIDATFFYPTEGHLLVQTAMKILTGRPYEHEIIIPALPAVDRSNADILLRQDASLKSETDKMLIMKGKVNDYSSKYSTQTSLLILAVTAALLLFAFVFVLLRSSRQHKRLRVALSEQNRLLEQERDKQLELYRQLDAATQSKLLFFTNVSHDLRTPLTLIADPVERLAASPHLDDDERRIAALASRNVAILQRLINQILDFRKYESGKLELNLAEVDLAARMCEWVEAFQSAARKRQQQLGLNISADALKVAVDVEKIERVVFNLISNAIAHTPAGGAVNVSLCADDTSVVIAVEDTGEGIPPDKLPQIFDRFYQAHDRGAGSGLGLSLVKAFVELHQGTVAVDSTEGVGSRFVVTLPVRHAEAADNAAADIDRRQVEAMLDTPGLRPAADHDPSKPLALIIDDNADIRELLTGLLSPEYNIITAPDGSEGLRLAMRYIPDIILCDVMMPVMDGLECCRRLKSEVTTSHIPVLMLTARSLDEQRLEGYESGADGYIAKPFSGAVLLARCRNLLLNRKRIKDLYSSVEQAVQPRPRMPLEGPSGERTDIDSDFYARFIEVLSPQLGNADLSIEYMARELGLSQSQLTRKIKALTNFTPVELIRNLRVAAARRLLSTTDSPISEIAYSTGFTSAAYFSKCYRDAYGETPTELRRRLGK